MTRITPTAARTRMSRALIVSTTLTLLCMTAGAQAQVKYVYDELGRLIAVVAPSGEAAVYAYDAVGNLLSITRTPAATVSIVSFHPRSGPTGTSVTVYGTAFSATPSRNGNGPLLWAVNNADPERRPPITAWRRSNHAALEGTLSVKNAVTRREGILCG